MKINEQKRIQKRRTEQEMRSALADFCYGKATRSIPPQIDDTDIILQDCIEELLELRALREEVAAFAQSLKTKIGARY